MIYDGSLIYRHFSYTYRIVYPDGLGEWYFRDECSRVVRHIDTDAAVNEYEFDENGSLTTITQSDGATFSKKK